MSSGGESEITPQVYGASSTIQTRSIDEVPTIYPILDEGSLDQCMHIDVKPWINRPFYCTTIPWTTSSTRFSSLTPANFFRMPADVILSNPALVRLMQSAAFYKQKLCLNISLTGTISHQGMLLVGILPPSTADARYPVRNGTFINTMLSGPHAFLSANEASSTCLEVPWYCNTDYAALDVSGTGSPSSVTTDFCYPNSNFATLVITVLNPLLPGDGASTTLSVVIEAFFKELDLYVPSPRSVTFSVTPPTMVGESLFAKAGTKVTDVVFNSVKKASGDVIDIMRGTFRSITGLHNPNDATLRDKEMMSTRNYNNTVDSQVRYEKLDPYSTIDRITDEPIFNTTTDEMMIKRIISKPQYLGTFNVLTTSNTGALLFCRPISPYQGGTQVGTCISNNIELLHLMTRAWKGSLKIHIQSVMNNKQNTKLKVIKYYAPPSACLTGYPSMTDIVNAPSDLLEFSAGNQTLTVDIPFHSRNRLLYNTRDVNSAATMMGMYYIYLAQPLVVADSAISSVEFNVYMSCGEDFQFYGYSTEVGRVIPTVPAALEGETREMEGESAEVMNAPSKQSVLRSSNDVEKDIYSSRLTPLVDIRPLIRRNQFGFSGSVTIAADGTANYALPLSSLICETTDSFYRGSVGLLPAMFYGKNPGLKFKLKVRETAAAAVSFVPPNCNTDSASRLLNTYYRKSSVDGPTSATPGFWSDFPSGIARPGLYPVPQVEFVNTWSISGSADSPLGEVEFSIPNTTIFKFVGGGDKMNTLSSTTLLMTTGDLGTLYFQFLGTPADVVQFVLYYSYTDETRLGFQVIAPLIQQPNASISSVLRKVTPYSITPGTLPPLALNPNIYFSNLNTIYS